MGVSQDRFEHKTKRKSFSLLNSPSRVDPFIERRGAMLKLFDRIVRAERYVESRTILPVIPKESIDIAGS